MNGALFRLFRRSNLIWEVLVTCILARLVSGLCAAAESVWFAERGPEDMVYESSQVLMLHLALMSGVVVGLLANVALQDMGYCRFTWTLPGYGKSLRKELALLAGIAALLSALGFAIFTGDLTALALPTLLPPALTLLGFGLGTLLWDPRVGKTAGIVAGVSLLALLMFTRPLAPAAEDAAALILVVGFVLSAYAIRRSTSRAALRARALVKSSELGTAYQPPASVAPYNAAKLAHVKGWLYGPIASLRSWMLALLFEGGGWIRGGWVKRSVGTGLGVSTLVSLILIGMGMRRGGTLDNGLAWMAQAVFDPRAHIEGVVSRPPEHVLALGFATTVFLLVLGTRQDLRHGVLYPLSRRDRAIAVWRAGLAQAVTGVGATALAFSFFGTLGLLLTDFTLPYRRVPEVITVAILCAALLPILQWFRLRFLESARSLVSPTAYSAGSGIASGAFAAAVSILAVLIRRASPDDAALLTYVSLTAAFVFSQYVYYRWIAGWFGRVDLA